MNIEYVNGGVIDIKRATLLKALLYTLQIR